MQIGFAYSGSSSRKDEISRNKFILVFYDFGCLYILI